MTTKGRTRTHPSADTASKAIKRTPQDKRETHVIRKTRKNLKLHKSFRVEGGRLVDTRTISGEDQVIVTTGRPRLSKLTSLSIPPEGSKYRESDEMMLRWETLLERTTQVMGSLADAREWLEAPEYIFDDEAPIVVAQTDEGYEEVYQLLGRIEHGVFS